ncbi:MAG: sigma-70 family RNA polymerase sigma factor [Eubacteriaceae bacterium]|nr:sigma-70 family RNA polymerase sigma factor [Eubacteriaceae bacterium]
MDLERVYEENFITVYRYVLSLSRNPHIAEEVTQETFFKALKNVKQFRGDCSLSVWLCQIAKNTYFKHLDKSKVQDVLKQRMQDSESCVDGPEHAFIRKETTRQIHKVLHDMDEPYKEVFSLRTFGELSYGDIGELFGKSENWARVTYYRAKMKIKEALGNEDNM